MLVKTGEDMILETRVALDKIESFRNESFQSEEILLFLNKSQFRLLDDLINKNFQQGTLRYEWIRPFQSISTGVTAFWDEDPRIFAAVTFPTDLYYLISATGVSTKSALNPGDSFDDNCDQPIVDPGSIINPVKKLVNIDILETGQAVDRTHNAFYGNNARSPRGEAYQNGIKLYRDETFIITDIIFDYIREPLEIVDDTSTLEWNVSASQKIIDYTVEYMRLTIADPTYQGNVNDFNTRTQNA